ncbi:hypothetical protein LXL04_016988 [Taraxacum kok-saghyz]
MPKCVTYMNGEAKGDKKVTASVLTNANALFLDRHWTVRSLSAFVLNEMERLKLCLLAECNEILEIVNGSHLDDRSICPILGSLEHLLIHYMKSLTCILNRLIDSLYCKRIKSLVSLESDHFTSSPFLKSLKKMSLLDLPELWPTGQPDYLDFIVLGTDDDDITDEPTDAVNLLPYLGIGESTKEAQTVEIITGPGEYHMNYRKQSDVNCICIYLQE